MRCCNRDSKLLEELKNDALQVFIVNRTRNIHHHSKAVNRLFALLTNYSITHLVPVPVAGCWLKGKSRLLRMNFFCQLLLAAASLIAISVVNEVLSSEYHAHDHWLRPDDIIEVRHCLSPSSLNEEKQSCRLYTIVIDAGSTGTRMHLFEFSYDISKNTLPFLVEKETFKEVKPGLSAFAMKPERAADSVSELITAAKATVPRTHWQYTPITLRATAGLRLLPSKEADSILSSVRERVSQSGFLLDADGVDIMSGTDEGVFSWFTLNVLTDRLQHIIRPDQNDDRREGSPVASKSSHLAAAALDLGGGSTQITFKPFDRTKVFAEVDETEFSHRLNIFESHVELYTHSYLGNGLMSARLGITQGTSGSKGSYLMSNCLLAGASINDWNYDGKLWNITGASDASFTACLLSAIKYVNETAVQKVPELNEHDLYVFSYFYDRGVQGDLIPRAVDSRGGHSTVKAYKDAAMRACSLSAEQLGPEHWKPWQCLDMSYIYVLLRYGYGLEDNKRIFLAKRLRNMEMSWALGAAYRLLHTHTEKSIAAGVLSTNTSTTAVPSNKSTFVDELLAFISEQTITMFTYLKIIS
uniref:Uncharacterized protein n=1 Tax=Parascaris univalens TaxID=6257 RepID=A0A915B289_PARUN